MSFLGFHTSTAQQQHELLASPQRIGGLNHPRDTSQRTDVSCIVSDALGQQPPSGAAELQRLAQEYRAEAVRLAEQLRLCGINRHSLSFEALNSLKLLVQLACALKVTQATPQVLLGAWAVLLVKHSKAATLQNLMHDISTDNGVSWCCTASVHGVTGSIEHWQHKLQHELALMAHKRHAAQQKLAVLQKLLTDVRSVQQKDTVKALQASKVTRQAQEKDAGYKAQMGKLQQKLEKSGFSPQLTHTALQEKHSQLQALQQQLEALQQQINTYHCLPATLLGARMTLEEAKQQLSKKEQHMTLQMTDAY